ncbi:MAG: hypothetical protein ACFFDU_01530 [Candidatus Thorarchaeota archaeon]
MPDIRTKIFSKIIPKIEPDKIKIIKPAGFKLPTPPPINLETFKIQPPKHPIYPRLTRSIFDALVHIEKHKEYFKTEVRNAIYSHCARAVEAAFKGLYHIARNYLVLVVNETVKARGAKLTLTIPEGITPAQLGKLSSVGYQDKKTGKDLWDAIRLEIEVSKKNPGVERIAIESAPRYMAIQRFRDITKLPSYEDVVYDKVLGASYEASKALTHQRECEERMTLVLKQYDSLMAVAALEATKSYRKQELSGIYKTHLKNSKIVDDVADLDGVTWNQQIEYFRGAFLIVLALARVFERDHPENYTERKKHLKSLEKIIEHLRHLFIYLENHVHAEEAKVNSLRERVNDNSIWNLIGNCIENTDQYQKFLNDWWGLKKYIALFTCAQLGWIELITAGPLAFLSIFRDILTCLLGWILGGPVEADPSSIDWWIRVVIPMAAQILDCMLRG